MSIPIVPVIFYSFAALMIFAAVMVISVRNPVHSVLCLVLTFFCASVLWMLLQAEFLALVLLFVYVGAVMTLFLFVVMMLNLDLSRLKEHFVRYLPYGVVVLAAFVAIMVMVVLPNHLTVLAAPIESLPSTSNTAAMGILLFTQHILAFEVAGLILLVAIVAAITLAFHGRKPGTKAQKIAQQHQATKQARLRLVSMKADNP